MYEFTKEHYRRAFPSPLPYERGLYNFGFDPMRSGERFYKDLDAPGLARLFAEFERLYDSNYQAYHWLYHTGYGNMVYTMLKDVLERDHGSEFLSDHIIRAIEQARKELKN